MVPPRKRKMVQTCPATTTFSVGNCLVEFPSDADQEFTMEKLSLQVNQFASVKISVDKSKTQASETPSPCTPGSILSSGPSFQLINPKSLDKTNDELLERTTQLYKQELPAMSFAADTGKESDFLRSCTMSGKYCSLLMKKPGNSPTHPEIVVGAITYQILPTSTQYAEIPLAAVDQSCQRQGLGKLLVRELARRLTDVGVLTLFCWGDQESELFWKKQGFLKIAEVDAQGKPQKLRLKNEIRKAMSLPGNSALMVCNLPHVDTHSTSMDVGGSTHPTTGPNNVNPTIEKEVKARRKKTHVRAPSLDPYSLRNDSLERTHFPSDASPAPVVTPISCPNRDGANSNVKTYVKGSCTKPISSPAKSNRTLRFAEIDEVAETGKGISGSVPPDVPECENSGPVVKSCLKRVSDEKVSSKPSIDNPPNNDVEPREALGNVQNIYGQDVVAPVKKRPWKRTQCDNPKVTAAIEVPQSTDTGCGPGEENKELARKETSGSEHEGNFDALKSCLKRPRAETLPGKLLGRRSVRTRRSDSPLPEPQLSDPASISEQALTAQKTGTETANPVFQTPETRVPKPASISELILAAQKAGTVNHGVTRDAKPLVDCKQSIADESVLPSSLNARLQNQGKDSVIRKRLSTRLVHVPEVGEDSGYLKDFAKTTTPVVFLMNMPNDPKKKALAQFGQLVQKLGGKVTGDGGECTHVVTNEVRRTLNFCTALCTGAWVVTPEWLKASSRHKSFVEEESYLLRDKQFESKYKVSLATTIQAAQRKPRSLFAGFSVYPTPHVQPPLDIVTKLTKVAGGKVLSSLEEALQQNDPSRTIVLTCDEDKEEHDVAAKAGLRTCTGEWLMQAIVKQRVDFDTIILSDH